MNTLADNLRDLEDSIRRFPSSVHIEVTVRATINNDVPNGYVSVSKQYSGEYESYEKVLDADGGMVTKSICLHIHD